MNKPMHGGHFTLVCPQCDGVMGGCRCPSTDKPRQKSPVICRECQTTERVNSLSLPNLDGRLQTLTTIIGTTAEGLADVRSRVSTLTERVDTLTNAVNAVRVVLNR